MNWPDKTKYCVHEFQSKFGETAYFFRDSLTVRDSEGPLYRLRKSSVPHWWYYDHGSWWFKAHDRTFDCEEKWAGVGLRTTR